MNKTGVWALAAAMAMAPALRAESKTLTDEDKVEILRGLEAEYGKAKVLFPRSRKALPYERNGDFDSRLWQTMSKDRGVAARVGDEVQITEISFDSDRIVLQFNHGYKGGRHWYDNIQGSMGGPMPGPMGGQGTNAPGGTTLAILFHGPVPRLQSADLKKMLEPILDFAKGSVAVDYVSTLPPAMQSAIKDKRAVEGMDRDEVVMAMGKPRTKDRQTRDGTDFEDWIYGEPPGKITFVTFTGGKVVKVKEEYAGLGGSTVPNLAPH